MPCEFYLVLGSRCFEEIVECISTLAFRVVIGENDTCTIGQNLECTFAIKPLKLFNERKDVTFGATAKTVFFSSFRRHRKRS